MLKMNFRNWSWISFILINPGGGWITKQWAIDKFAQLIDLIYNDLHIPALILWGPGEKQLADKIARKCISPAHDFVQHESC